MKKLKLFVKIKFRMYKIYRYQFNFLSLEMPRLPIYRFRFYVERMVNVHSSDELKNQPLLCFPIFFILLVCFYETYKYVYRFY